MRAFIIKHDVYIQWENVGLRYIILYNKIPLSFVREAKKKQNLVRK